MILVAAKRVQSHCPAGTKGRRWSPSESRRHSTVDKHLNFKEGCASGEKYQLGLCCSAVIMICFWIGRVWLTKWLKVINSKHAKCLYRQWWKSHIAQLKGTICICMCFSLWNYKIQYSLVCKPGCRLAAVRWIRFLKSTQLCTFVCVADTVCKGIQSFYSFSWFVWQLKKLHRSRTKECLRNFLLKRKSLPG